MLPLLIPAISAGVSVLGKILGNKESARTSTSTTMPTFAPEFKTLGDLLRARATDNLNNSMDMSGVQANGIANINDAYAGVQQRSDANLTARGLGASPIAGAVGSNFDMARGGSIAEFLNTLPQLQRQYQNQDFSNALNVLNLGRGTDTKTVGAGSAAGAGLDDLSSWLGYIARTAQLAKGGA